MKKFIASAFLAVVLFSFSVVPAFAAGGYSKVEPTVGSNAYTSYNLFKNGTGYFVLHANAGSRAGLTYVNFISLESLSDLCTQANGYGLNCSLFYNYYDDAFYILVDDSSLFGLDSTRGVIGNTDGYVLGAKDTSVDLTDTNDLLDWIRRNTSGIASQVAHIDDALTSEDGPFALWMELLDTDLNLVNINLEQISLKVQSVVDYTNVIANGTVTMVGQMDELIEAVKGISINADGATINFDTLPITDKLDEVITAIEGISINVEGSTINFDTLPITDKLDELIGAVNNLSVSTDPVGFGGGACAGTFVSSELCSHESRVLVSHDAISELCLIVNDQINQGLYDDVFPFCDATEPLSASIVNYEGDVSVVIAVEFDGALYYLVNDSGALYMGYPADDVYFFMVSEIFSNAYFSEDGPISVISGKLQEVALSLMDIFAQLRYSGPAVSGIWSPTTLYDYVMEVEKWLSMIASDTDFLSDIAIDTGDGLKVLQSIEERAVSMDANLDDVLGVVGCEHSYASAVLVEPSCDLPGAIKYTCYYCGFVRIEPTAPLGHEWLNFAPEEPVALLEDVDLSLIPGSNPPMLSCIDVIELVPGAQYRVIYNGAEYLTECAMVDYSGMSVPAVGNIDAFLGTGDNGCPFVLASAELLGGTGGFDFTGASAATVSIYTVPADTGTEEVPEYLQSLHICSRCDSGSNLAGLMVFLDERLHFVPGSGGSIDVTPIVDKLTSIENALSNLGGDVDIENNTNIEVSEDNDSYNVFYVEDPDSGDDQSIVDLSGDALTVFGKLLNFLYQVGFKDALDGAGPGIGDLSDFYLDNAEGSADLWVS